MVVYQKFGPAMHLRYINQGSNKKK